MLPQPPLLVKHFFTVYEAARKTHETLPNPAFMDETPSITFCEHPLNAANSFQPTITSNNANSLKASKIIFKSFSLDCLCYSMPLLNL